MSCRCESCFLFWTTVSLTTIILLFTSMYFIDKDPSSESSKSLILTYLIISGIILVILSFMFLIALCMRTKLLYDDIKEKAIERLKNEMKEETYINIGVNKE